jgi:DNA invertase Pin-like site-specific DNA recombinase
VKANRSGALIRVSSGAQDAKLQRASILAQVKADGREVTKWYELDGVSAFHGEQEQALADALADTQSGEIRALYLFNTDRADRRGIFYTLQFRHEIMRAGGVLISATQPYCKDDTPEAEQLLAADAGRARSESATKQMRQNLLVIPEIRGNGAFFGKPPFGYRITGDKFTKRLEPTDVGRQYIPEIYERIIRGDSLAVVAWWLDSRKIKFRPDGTLAPWWPAMISRLVRNPVYVGHCQTDDGLWVHETESLVDPTTFRLANEALGNRKRKQRGPRGRPENRAMLKGALRCPACGSTMTKNVSINTRTRHGGPSKPYYRCRGTGPAQQGCGVNTGMEAADAAVDAIMAADFNVPVMLRVLVKGRDYAAELDQVALELRQLAARGLSRADERAERERLWAEEDRLGALTPEDDRWELVPTGEFYAEVYAKTPRHDRGAWLARHGFTVTADKTLVTVRHGTEAHTRRIGAEV